MVVFGVSRVFRFNWGQVLKGCRKGTGRWCKALGADHVVRERWAFQGEALGPSCLDDYFYISGLGRPLADKKQKI